jgi:peptidoglycan/xylan/chitin deacetylase (PgdA/CDA1 family)
MRALGVAILGVALVASVSSDAIGWPMPAGGESRSGGPELLLTFDDGPHPHTTALLDELDRRGHKAIFFWVGARVRKGDPEQLAIVERTVQTGHLVANHTVNHINLCQVGDKQRGAEIDTNREIFEKLVGMPVAFFRAPYGVDCPALRETLDDREMTHVHWDIDPQEWKNHSTKHASAFVINKLKRLGNRRAILLMHDTQYTTTKTMPKVFDWIEEENARRAKTKRKPIRIVPPSEWVEDQLDPEFATWAKHSAAKLGDGLTAALGSLIP